MTKQDIINQTAQATGQSKSQTAQTINTAVDLIKDVVASGLTISIRSFISITPITKKAISGEINGTKYSKPERQGIKLKASKLFKDLVEKGVAGVQDVQK